MSYLGRKVLIVGYFHNGSIGIVEKEKPKSGWDYAIRFPLYPVRSHRYPDRFLFRKHEVVLIPKNATEEQIKALKSICQK